MDTHQRQRVVVSRPVAGHWDRAPATRRTRRRLRQRPARRCSQARQASRANSTERPSIALIASSSCPTRFPITGGGTHVPVSASRSFCGKGLWRATPFAHPSPAFQFDGGSRFSRRLLARTAEQPLLVSDHPFTYIRIPAYTPLAGGLTQCESALKNGSME